MSKAENVAVSNSWIENRKEYNKTKLTDFESPFRRFNNNNKNNNNNNWRRPFRSPISLKNRKANILIESDFGYIDDDDETIVINRSSDNREINSDNFECNDATKYIDLTIKKSGSDCCCRQHIQPTESYSTTTYSNSNGKSKTLPLAKTKSSSTPASPVTLTVDDDDDNDNVGKSANNRRRRKSSNSSSNCETKQTGNCNYTIEKEYLMIGSETKFDDVQRKPSTRTSPSLYRKSEQWLNDSQTHHKNNNFATIPSSELTIQNNCNGKINYSTNSNSTSVTKDTRSTDINSEKHLQNPQHHNKTLQCQNTQRLNNSNINNKENISSISTRNCPEKSLGIPQKRDQGIDAAAVVPDTHNTETSINNSRNYSQKLDNSDDGNNETVGNQYFLQNHKNKMTITKTTIASRKRSSSLPSPGAASRTETEIKSAIAANIECGAYKMTSPELTTETSMTAMATPPQSPTTVTTVIKTTLVKRSRNDESDINTNTNTNFIIGNNSNGKCCELQQKFVKPVLRGMSKHFFAIYSMYFVVVTKWQ